MCSNASSLGNKTGRLDCSSQCIGGSKNEQENPSMNTRTKLTALATVLALGVGGYAFADSSAYVGPNFGPPHVGRIMGAGMGHPPMMGMGNGSASSEELGVIHQLIANHDKIRRTVTNLADGIRTETTSDDPKVADWIKTHVGKMGERVAAGDDPGLPMESSALHSIFRNKDKVQTKIETIDKGVVVTQTSTDAAVVAALQEHAKQVSEFVKGGMAAVHTAMMANAGRTMGPGMMHGMMGRGMMFGGGGMHQRMMRGGGMMHGPN
jgi:hypothetical protein